MQKARAPALSLRSPVRSIRRPYVCRQCRKYASVATAPSGPQRGEQLHGFTVKRTKHVPELELTAFHLQHDKTGAEYLHVARDDKNNVFSIGFKTNPPDHTGVPHILEHLALCGSEKYPVRDPFFKMMPRSLSNFMNAMTYPDHTVYPFATTNHQDFKNLMSVYLDATLHPLLKQQDFTQEGWRVGPENPQLLGTSPKIKEQDNLVFKGVVYNEMKGAMSNGDDVFTIRWRDHLFPAINNSGGIPQQMTNLTHEKLKEFHAAHYHPSNAKLFTYGDIPLTEHLKEAGPQLDAFDPITIEDGRRVPIALTAPQSIRVQGPVDPLYPKNEQFKASLSWLMCDTSDVLETFSLALISSLLLDGFGAPLYENTVGMGTGASFSPNTGFDSSGNTAIFSVGLSGLKAQDLSRIHDIVGTTMQAVRRNGLDEDKIESRLHQIELGLKHKTANYGMGLMSRLQDGWFNGIDPFSTVAPGELIKAFRKAHEDTGYLNGLYQRYFLTDNIFTFIMEPSEEYGQNLVTEEAKRLDAKITEISSQYKSREEAVKSLEQQELDLLDAQEKAKSEDLSCLPTLRTTDIPREKEKKQVRYSTIDDTKIQWRTAPTNGITYFKAVHTFDNLPDDLRIYLPLFSAAIQRLGTRKHSIAVLEEHIKLRTGGVFVDHHSSTSPYDTDVCEDGLSFGGHALDQNVEHLLAIIRILVRETNFDARNAGDVLGELVKAAANSSINSVAESGSAYAQRFAEAGISPQARLHEEVEGMTQMKLMMDLAARAADGLEDVIDKMKAIQLFSLAKGSSLRVALTCGPESTSANEAHLAHWFTRLPSRVSAPVADSQISYPRNVKSLFPLPYQVYYTAMSLRTVPYTDKASAPLGVLAELLTHKRIHHEIREKGGAYGGSAYAAGLRGTFGFTSYRDPNPLNSLKVMREAGAWAREKAWTERDIEEAKLSIFQNLDAPQSVDEEGMTKFLAGVDEEMQQTRREQLLNVKAKDVNEVAHKFVAQGVQDSNIAVLGKKMDWVKEEDGWVEMPMSIGETVTAVEDEDGYLTV